MTDINIIFQEWTSIVGVDFLINTFVWVIIVSLVLVFFDRFF